MLDQLILLDQAIAVVEAVRERMAGEVVSSSNQYQARDRTMRVQGANECVRVLRTFLRTRGSDK